MKNQSLHKNTCYFEIKKWQSEQRLQKQNTILKVWNFDITCVTVEFTDKGTKLWVSASLKIGLLIIFGTIVLFCDKIFEEQRNIVVNRSDFIVPEGSFTKNERIKSVPFWTGEPGIICTICNFIAAASSLKQKKLNNRKMHFSNIYQMNACNGLLIV